MYGEREMLLLSYCTSTCLSHSFNTSTFRYSYFKS